MGKRINSIITFFDKHYSFFLFLIVLISYGQILGMYVWQDDNGLFFKLAHISENAGYLSAGPFGTGAYKYIVTPYIPIYYLFGYNTVAYFAYNLIIYYLTALVVYKVFSKILGLSAGKIIGFIYAAGYIASDGIIRIFNSVSTSVSVMILSAMLLGYWNFYKQGKILWYLVALLSFFLALELTPARTHYLISVVVIFELIFLAFNNRLKSLFWSMLRIIPFVYIFYRYFIINADYRSGQVGHFLSALMRGEWYQTYSLATSFANVTLADWFMNRWQVIPASLVLWVIMLVGIASLILMLRNHSWKKILIPVFIILMIGWKIIVDNLFLSPVLNIGQSQLLIVFFGGWVALLLLAAVAVVEKYRKLFIFLCLWVVLNIAAYAAYNPLIAYESINRYLAHSFFAWAGVLGIFYLVAQKSLYRKLVTLLIIAWGVGNLLTAVVYQNRILEIRSNPPRAFYNQLMEYVPQAKKGDVFYFDVADNARNYFEDAFSVASMPETTAIAWRYGIDRYDIKRFTEFSELGTYLAASGSAGNVKPEQIHAFWYSADGLVNTSEIIRDRIFRNQEVEEVQFEVKDDSVLKFNKTISIAYPIELTLSIQPQAADPSKLSFPHKSSGSVSAMSNQSEKIDLIIDYKKSKEEIVKSSKYVASSQWRDRITSYINDQNPDTSWQADRVLWQKRLESMTIDLGTSISISKLAWINGFGNNTPSRYHVDLSNDGINWKTINTVSTEKRVDTKEPQVVSFDPTTARFVKMVITNTLAGDSPIISEMWVVPSKYDQLDIVETEKYLSQPFAFVPDIGTYAKLLQAFDRSGDVQIFWQTDKHSDWYTEYNRKVKVVYNGAEQQAKILLPAGGTTLTQIKLVNITIPGTVIVKRVNLRYPKIEELYRPQ